MRVAGLAAVIGVALWAAQAPAARAATFAVTSTADTTAAGTLRSAIMAANAAPDPDTISFAIGSGAKTISLGSSLPTITGPVAIDGTTQPGYAGTPLITLDGGAGAFDCLVVDDKYGGSTFEALDIANCFFGVRLEGKGGHNVLKKSTIHGNNAGVLIENSPGNTIGGILTDRDVIGDNQTGVIAYGPRAKGNNIIGNYVGLNAAGNAAVPNAIGLNVDAPKTLVAANVVSGNTFYGIGLGPGSRGSVADVNYVGTDATGASAIGNHDGVVVTEQGVVITENLISGNSDNGVKLESRKALVSENTIGLALGGSAMLGNGTGVVVESVGGLPVGRNTIADNLISGNSGDGVFLASGAGNTVRGNYIGTDSTGMVAMPNGRGVDAGTSAGSQLIGGDGPAGEGNLISGNTGEGILTGAPGVQIRGNLIGTDETGLAALPNDTGIAVANGSATVGGTRSAFQNVVSGNTNSGIAITGGTRTVVEGNYVGVGSDGVTDVGNGAAGIATSVAGVRIGRFGSRNVTCWNLIGIYVTGDSNVVQGNHVGMDIHAQSAPNSLGIVVAGDHNLIGGTKLGSGNVVGANTNAGISVTSSGEGNSLLRNVVFPNGGLGIDLGTVGVTPNDSGDPDTGANGYQNFPMLTGATVANGKVTFTGTLNTTPGRAFRIEFFSNNVCDGSGYGEGMGFEGTRTVKTDGSGNAAFSATFKDVIGGAHFSATATDLTTGDTSEFGNCV